jgi:hypothetical protein
MKEYNFEPILIDEIDDDGHIYYSIVISAGKDNLKEAEDLFEIYENYPNGYGWEGLIKYLIEEECPDLLDYLEFNSEGGAFVVSCDDEDKAIQLATLLQNLVLDKDELSKYLKELPDDYKDA